MCRSKIFDLLAFPLLILLVTATSFVYNLCYGTKQDFGDIIFLLMGLITIIVFIAVNLIPRRSSQHQS